MPKQKLSEKGVDALLVDAEMLDLDLIKTYWRNPRKSEEAVPFVADSIERYGFNVPIVLDAKRVIICGHSRYRAARQLKLKKVPVIYADLTEEQAREFRIIDNKTSEKAAWDTGKLKAELLKMADLAVVRAKFGGPQWESILSGNSLSTPAAVWDAPPPSDDAIERNRFEVVCPHCGVENIIQLTEIGKKA